MVTLCVGIASVCQANCGVCVCVKNTLFFLVLCHMQAMRMGTFTIDKATYALNPTTLIVATHRLNSTASAAQHEDAKARLPRALVRTVCVDCFVSYGIISTTLI